MPSVGALSWGVPQPRYGFLISDLLGRPNSPSLSSRCHLRILLKNALPKQKSFVLRPFVSVLKIEILQSRYGRPRKFESGWQSPNCSDEDSVEQTEAQNKNWPSSRRLKSSHEVSFFIVVSKQKLCLGEVGSFSHFPILAAPPPSSLGGYVLLSGTPMAPDVPNDHTTVAFEEILTRSFFKMLSFVGKAIAILVL